MEEYKCEDIGFKHYWKELEPKRDRNKQLNQRRKCRNCGRVQKQRVVQQYEIAWEEDDE